MDIEERRRRPPWTAWVVIVILLPIIGLLLILTPVFWSGLGGEGHPALAMGVLAVAIVLGSLGVGLLDASRLAWRLLMVLGAVWLLMLAWGFADDLSPSPWFVVAAAFEAALVSAPTRRHVGV